MPRTCWLAVGALAGALLAGSGDRLVLAGAATCLALVGLATIGRRRSASLMALGAALIVARALVGPAEPAPFSEADWAVGADVMRRAVVVTTYAPGAGSQRAVLELGPDPGGAARAYASLPRYPAVGAGDVVELDGRLELAPPPGDSGFAGFLERSGIAYTVRARRLQLVSTGDTPAAALHDVRRGAGDLLGRALPEPQAGLATAVLVGLRDRVSRDVTEDFRVAGLSHVVAISGFHIALVAALAGALLRPLARQPRSVALLCLLAGYALLAGASPSVLRATAMAGTVLVLRICGRRGQAAAALGVAVLLLLVFEPATVTEVGFQLSVAATAGLLRWASSFGEWLRSRLPASLPDWLVETLSVSLAAQLATLPLVLLHFGRLSLVAPLANMLAAPLIPPAMASAGLSLGAGAAASGGVPDLLMAPLILLAAATIGALVTVAELCAGLPLASVEVAPPLDLAAAVAAGLLVLLAARPRAARRRVTGGGKGPSGRATRAGGAAVDRPGHGPSLPRRRRLAAGVVAVLVLAVLASSVVAARPDGRLRMSVLDVGQGDAILLVGPAGSRLLVDTGPDPDLLLRQLDARLPAWDRRIDLVVITHPHEDHVAGLALLLERYRIGSIAEPGMIGLGPGDAAFRERLAGLGRTTRILGAGDRFTLDGADVDVRWPLPGRVPSQPASGGKDVNNVSIVLDISFGQRRLLLTGDIEEEVDRQLLLTGLSTSADRPFDVLKVAHHGSRTATTDELLEQVAPKIALISAGAYNPYGHPSPATVARLQARGARVLRTDIDGSIEVSTNGVDLVVGATGGRPRAAAALGAGDLGAWAARGGAVNGRAPGEWAAARGPGFCPIPIGPGLGQAGSYNRFDDRPLPLGRRAAAARPRASRLAAPTQRRGSRRGGLPGRARTDQRCPGRCRPGGGSGPPSRHRQGTSGRRPAQGAGARGRRGGTSDRKGTRRARSGDRQPSGQPTSRRRPLAPVEPFSVPRGAARCLC
jgi:competence protein ComEC